jgi:hypothetical protein
MNANELRLGNWVHPQFPMQVVDIYKDEIQCNFEGNQGDVWDFNPKDLDGIPLSEEWLEKFGFEGTEFLIAKGNFTYNCQTKILTWFGIMLHNSLWNEVHQLQNLYFALTGEEL